MKILFLQKVDNAKGGIATVNLKLMSYFLSLGHQVDVLSVRHGDTWEKIEYPKGARQHIINKKNVWGAPRLSEAVKNFKRGRILKTVRVLKKRVVHNQLMNEDYEVCKKKIEEINPDIIINSHYEVLRGISDPYLKKTIMHFHTSFDQVLANKSYQSIFNKYADKIGMFVWLSEKTKDQAEAYGFKKSTFIYNPISFASSERSDMTRKKMIFMGRLSEEKRIHLAINYFREVIREEGLNDWVFEIYGDGHLKDEINSMIQEDSQIIYRGRTENVKDPLLESSVLILTSEFEGMPLVVLEANECGVPVLAYDFGESSQEVIRNGITGVIVPQNDENTFKEELKKMLLDEDYRERLSINAKEYAKSFSLEQIGQCWLKLFYKMENIE